MKKMVGKNSKRNYEIVGLVPEFMRVSKMRGLGFDYYEKNKEKIYTNDELFILKDNQVIRSCSISYYDRLFEKEWPSRLVQVKSARVARAINHNELVLSQVDLDYFDYTNLLQEQKEKSLVNLKKRII